MSFKVSELAVAADLPKGEKAVLKALADRARHDGTHAYPGVPRIARETSCSERHVQRMLRSLEAQGLIWPVAHMKGGRKKATEYSINLVALEAISLCRKGDIHSPQRVTSAPEKGVTVSPQHPYSSFGTSWSAQGGPGETLRGEPQAAAHLNRAGQYLKTLAGKKDFRNTVRPSGNPWWAHMESGIYRKGVAAGYLDCTHGGLGEQAAMREAIHQAALSLLSNRAVELRGIDVGKLKGRAWQRLEQHVSTLGGISDYQRREQMVVQAVIRTVLEEAQALSQQGAVA